jgi:hypothetical protein
LGNRDGSTQDHDPTPDQSLQKTFFEHWPIHLHPSPVTTASLRRFFDARNLQKTLSIDAFGSTVRRNST